VVGHFLTLLRAHNSRRKCIQWRKRADNRLNLSVSHSRGDVVMRRSDIRQLLWPWRLLLVLAAKNLTLPITLMLRLQCYWTTDVTYYSLTLLTNTWNISLIDLGLIIWFHCVDVVFHTGGLVSHKRHAACDKLNFIHL